MSILRENAVRLAAIGVLGGALLVAISGVSQAWTLLALATGVTFVMIAVLVLVVSRRQYRAIARFKDTAGKTMSTLLDEASSGKNLHADVQELRDALGSASLHISELTQALARLEVAGEKHFEAHSKEIRRVRHDISLLSREFLTDSQAVLQLMKEFDPIEPLPGLSGWALSPSGLVWLTRHIARTQPQTVVECGSGTSTLWCAMALRANGVGHLTALDHDPAFAEKTRQTLERHGLSEWATVLDAPLAPQATPRGTFAWYDTYRQDFGEIELLLVDGPPAATGPHARYPAMPLLAPYLVEGAAVVVDDMVRSDEREVVAFWLEEFVGLKHRGEVCNGIALLDYTRE